MHHRSAVKPSRTTNTRSEKAGEVPDGWTSKSVSEIGQVVTGGTPHTSNQAFWNGTIPFVTPTDLGRAKRVSNTGRRVTDEGLSRVREIPPGAVMVTCIASIGKLGIAIERCCTNQQINSVIAGDSVISEYLYYAMASASRALVGLAGTTAVPIVSKSKFSAHRVMVPPLSEQRKIAAVLSSVDEAIETTQAIVGQVRTTKGGMIKELFTRGIPGRHTRFKQTEIGRMPAEWTMASGIDLFRLAGGYGPSAIRFDDQGECLFVKVDSFNHRTNRSLILHADDRFSEINNPTIRLYTPGSLVFPKRGAAIFKNRVRLLGTRATVDPNLMVMTPKDDLVPDFLMYLLIHIELFNLCDNSGIPQLNNKHLYPKLFPVPTIDEQEEIAKSIRATMIG